MNELLPGHRDLVMYGQILLSLLLGGLIGFERERSNKPAGLRTHMLVAAGSAAFTLASIYGFSASNDTTRVAAQIVSGVGFLGAGTIFRSGSEVRGLTTAASVWVCAALGMLVATKMYWVAVLTGVTAALVLHFFPGRGDRPLHGESSLQADDAASVPRDTSA